VETKQEQVEDEDSSSEYEYIEVTASESEDNDAEREEEVPVINVVPPETELPDKVEEHEQNARIITDSHKEEAQRSTEAEALVVQEEDVDEYTEEEIEVTDDESDSASEHTAEGEPQASAQCVEEQEENVKDDDEEEYETDED